MKKTVFLLPLLLSLFALTGCAPDLLDLTTTEESDLTVDQLLARMTKATDPHGISAKAETFMISQEITSRNSNKEEKTQVTIYYKSPGFVRQVSSRRGKPFQILLVKGNRAWNIDPRNNKATVIPEGTPLNLVKSFTRMIKPEINHKKIFSEIRIDRKPNEKTQEHYYRLICSVEDPNIAPYVFYINPRTWLTEKFETILYGADGTGVLYQAYSENYVWRNQVRMPLLSIIRMQGKEDFVVTKRFELNTPIPDTMFDLPKKIWNH